MQALFLETANAARLAHIVGKQSKLWYDRREKISRGQGLDNDTICAPATPSGGALAVVRVSGKGAHAALGAVFGGLQRMEHAVMRHGYIEYGGRRIDEAMAVKFFAPRSYTGEDMAEIYCHGGRAVLSGVMDALSSAGARLAQPGEFTRRAFENGKMDLSSAGAVMELIGAESQAAARAALRQLSGGLKRRVEEMQRLLTESLAIIEAGIEYPEEDIEADIRRDALPRLEKAQAQARRLAETFAAGRVLKEGFSVAIAGRPNVGKSSLFNALLGSERAIVTAAPGTTRDTVDDCVHKDGILLRFVDTAGIRAAADEAERIGVERAKQAIQEADLKLFVIDGSAGVTPQDKEAFFALSGSILVILNKSDLPPKVSADEAREIFGCDAAEVSALTGQGIPELLARIQPPQLSDTDDVVITSERHMRCLSAAAQSLEAAIAAFDTADLDCVTIDIREAWERLGEITGVTAVEEIINEIFDTFCLGK
jgi:tRNA modification GTPase